MSTNFSVYFATNMLACQFWNYSCFWKFTIYCTSTDHETLKIEETVQEYLGNLTSRKQTLQWLKPSLIVFHKMKKG